MNIEEFIANHLDEEYGEVYDNNGKVPVLVHSDDWVDHKTCFQVEVYQIDEDYFEVTTTRDNTGYWSSGERYPPVVRKVKPEKKMVEITEWKYV